MRSKMHFLPHFRFIERNGPQKLQLGRNFTWSNRKMDKWMIAKWVKLILIAGRSGRRRRLDCYRKWILHPHKQNVFDCHKWSPLKCSSSKNVWSRFLFLRRLQFLCIHQLILNILINLQPQRCLTCCRLPATDGCRFPLLTEVWCRVYNHISRSPRKPRECWNTTSTEKLVLQHFSSIIQQWHQHNQSSRRKEKAEEEKMFVGFILEFTCAVFSCAVFRSQEKFLCGINFSLKVWLILILRKKARKKQTLNAFLRLLEKKIDWE